MFRPVVAGTPVELLGSPAGVGFPVLLGQLRGSGGEVVRAVGLAGGPVEEHLGGDRFEAGVLGLVPVRGGVVFDAGAVAEQLPVAVASAGTATMMEARLRRPILRFTRPLPGRRREGPGWRPPGRFGRDRAGHGCCAHDVMLRFARAGRVPGVPDSPSPTMLLPAGGASRSCA